jgi:hypothetical protein
MSINLNSTLPAAPAGSTNVTFQKDSSGNISAYVTSAPELTGDNIDLTGQTANISSTTVVSAPANGLYRVAGYIIVTTAGGVSSTLPSIVLTWTDQNNGQLQTWTLTPTASGNLLTTVQQNDAILSCGPATDLSFSTTGYASSGSAMQYAVHIRVEAL